MEAVELINKLSSDNLLPAYFIGGPEAAAIAFALDGVDPPRPLTHDLACTLVSELGSSLERVVITELRDTTFYADLHLADPGAGSARRDLACSWRPHGRSHFDGGSGRDSGWPLRRLRRSARIGR